MHLILIALAVLRLVYDDRIAMIGFHYPMIVWANLYPPPQFERIILYKYIYIYIYIYIIYVYLNITAMFLTFCYTVSVQLKGLG